MAGILIKGIEMPKEGFVEILIRSDGTVVQTGQSKRLNGRDYYVPYEAAIPQLFTAVSVPPHGRLIDADEAMRYKERRVVDADKIKKEFRYVIDTKYLEELPTVIPASKTESEVDRDS